TAKQSQPTPQSAQPVPPIPESNHIVDERQQKMEAPRQDMLREIQQAIEARDSSLRENTAADVRARIETRFQTDLNAIVHRYDVTWRASVGVPTTTQAAR